jgi:16S rRNA processing protein RimM
MPRKKKPIDRVHARQRPEYLVVGRIIRPHGIRGALAVDAESDLITSVGPGDILYIGAESIPVTVDFLRPHRTRYLLQIEGSTSREEAEHYRGWELKLRFDDVESLPEGMYYHWQILGLRVFTEAGEDLGQIEQIIETGANDVYLIRKAGGGEVLLPAIESVILNVDLGSGRMTVRLLPGLLDPG